MFSCYLTDGVIDCALARQDSELKKVFLEDAKKGMFGEGVMEDDYLSCPYVAGTIEEVCRMGAFFYQRQKCLDAYFQFLSTDKKKANELLKLTCDHENTYCSVNGKNVGRVKNKNKDGGRSVKSDQKRVDEKGSVIHFRYELIEWD